MQCTCRVCKKTYTYNDEVGYDRELCGPLCDGIEAGRNQAEEEIRRLKGHLSRISELDYSRAAVNGCALTAVCEARVALGITPSDRAGVVKEKMESRRA